MSRSTSLGDFDVVTGPSTPLRPLSPPSLSRPVEPTLADPVQSPGETAASSDSGEQPRP